MTEFFLHTLFTGIRQALFIWTTLIVVAVGALAFVALPHCPRDLSTLRTMLRHWISGQRAPVGRSVAAARRDDLARYADEIAVAARRAVATAEHRRAEWLAAHRFKETAWQAYDAAQRAAVRVLRANVYPTPRTSLTSEELANRDRRLPRAAVEALRRGEISPQQLGDIMRHRAGWDLGQHPCEQETKLRLIGQARLLRVYLTASAVERTSWQLAQGAAEAARALEDEATAAAIRAGRAVPRTQVSLLPLVAPEPLRTATAEPAVRAIGRATVTSMALAA